MRSEVHRFPPFDHEELSYIPLHQHYYLKMKIGDVIVYFINRRWGIISWPNCERTMTSIPFANAPVGWIWSYKIIKATMTLMMNFSVSCCWIRPRSSGVSNIFWHTCIKSNLSIRSLTPRHLFNICISYMFLIPLLPWPWLLEALLYCSQPGPYCLLQTWQLNWKAPKFE